jgi:chitin disaccharide deacetylase
MRPTHLDAHMAAAMAPELLSIQLRLAEEYGLFPVLPRSITWPPGLDAYRSVVAALDREGLPVIDHCRATLPVPAAELPGGWQRMIGELPQGVTHFALHATEPGEFTAIAPQHAPWRTAEFALLQSGAIAGWLSVAGVATSGYREFASRWRKARRLKD